jgi:dipeptidyl aminopeptidase/acylaminoacyl peptidase
VKPTDLAHLRFPGAPTISPDGARAAFTVTRIDLEEDEYRSRIWVADLDGSTPPRQLTHGVKDGQPRWSPDGRWIAFVRTTKADDAKPQLYLLPAEGGDARQVTDVKTGVGEFAWAPDSRRVAYLARVPEPGRYGTVEGRDADKEPPRRLTTFNFRRDNDGFIADRPQHVFVVDVLADDAEPTMISTVADDHSNVSWSADGSRVIALRNHADHTLCTDVVMLATDGGAERVLATPLALDAVIAGQSNDHLLAAGYDAGESGIDFVGRPSSLFRLALDGSAPERLTDPQAVDIDTSHAPGLLLEDDGSVLLAVLRRGGVHLVRRSTAGKITPVIDGQRQVIGFATAAGKLAATISDPTTAGELLVFDKGTEKVLTDLGSSYTQQATVFPMVELETKADDGYPVHGWVVRPSGPGPHPVLLMVHGGPFAQYGWALFDEAQVYAGAGYAVVMGNPRGSAGYGADHGRAIKGNLGDRDVADLMALLEAALESDDLDSERVGVLGGSYGGFMASWLAAHEGHRFKAALAERALTAWDSFEGSSDIGWFFGDEYVGADPKDVWRQSPLAYAKQITIPTFIVHSEQDWRCPVEQAQRLYVALKKQGTPTEMLLFPGEGHELSRSGLPSHRVARFEAVLEWFARWL